MKPEGLLPTRVVDDLELLSELTRAGRFREALRAFDERSKRGSPTPPPEAEYLAAGRIASGLLRRFELDWAS